MWIQLDQDYFNVAHAFALRRVKGNPDQCTLFPNGADPVSGGYLIELSVEDVFAAIQQARLIELSQMIDAESDEDSADPDPDDSPIPLNDTE
jgi:hypothetical protein